MPGGGSAALYAIGAAGTAAAAGLGYYLWSQGQTTTGCPAPDVAAPCPSGYTPDPAHQGCCMPTGTGGDVTFEISGNVGSISFGCPCTITLNDLVLQIAGATPNGVVAFYISPSEPEAGDWIELQEWNDPNGDGSGYVAPNADNYGNVSYAVSSCLLFYLVPQGGENNDGSTCLYASGCINSMCPGPSGKTYYLVGLDTTSGNYSNVISVTVSCDCGAGVSCCN